MRKAGVCAVLCLAAVVSATAADPPRRVASVNLTADEILVDILPKERLVAVTAFADDRGTSNVAGRVPSTAQRLPRADLERLVSLAPDLVVVSEYTDADFLKQLEASGLRYHRMKGLRSLAGFRESLLGLGRAVGEPVAAERLAQDYDATLRRLAKRLEGARRPRVLYWAESVTAGADTAIGAVIEGAGGINVGKELGLAGIVAIGAERAFLADPDVILVGEGFQNAESIRAHPLLSKSRAVREGRVVEMPGELLVTVSHYAARACWHLAHLLHPALVPEPLP